MICFVIFFLFFVLTGGSKSLLCGFQRNDVWTRWDLTAGGWWYQKHNEHANIYVTVHPSGGRSWSAVSKWLLYKISTRLVYASERPFKPDAKYHWRDLCVYMFSRTDLWGQVTLLEATILPVCFSAPVVPYLLLMF